MRCVIHLVSVSIAVFLLVQNAVAEEEAAARDKGPSSSAAPDKSAASDDARDLAAKPKGESWRYRRHNGRWWYWLPSEQWVFWTGSEWTKYDPKTFATYGSPRAYSYSGSGSYSTTQPSGNRGFWGPVIYNRYGVRQYPYSARSRGIQQLGPVPAMGGVRSLQGWGGER
jgi:hypothetical protein